MSEQNATKRARTAVNYDEQDSDSSGSDLEGGFASDALSSGDSEDNFLPNASRQGRKKLIVALRGTDESSASPAPSAGPRLKVKLAAPPVESAPTEAGAGDPSAGSRPGPSVDLFNTLFTTSYAFSGLKLKPDHASRPFYISPTNRHIILEAFHPLGAAATDFLIAIAEPVSRPSHIHEYKLTSHSLYAAVSVGLKTEDIIQVLNRMSKVPVPEQVKRFIRNSTVSYGKVKLVLKKNKHYVESGHPEILRILLQDKVIAASRVIEGENGPETAVVGEARYGLEQDKAPRRAGLIIPGTKPGGLGANAEGTPNPDGADAERADADNAASGSNAAPGPDGAAASTTDEDIFTAVIGLEREDDLDDDETVHAFEIKEAEIENVKRRCLDLDYPMMEEYDFRHDELNPTLEIDLKPTTMIRPYQEKSLGKMFGNGRARSGIIVLPCGAGKTLVGITAACTIRKSCIVLCTSGVSVMQWKQQFLQWSTLKEQSISVFTADQKDRFTGDAGIVISTYSMVANRQKRSYDSQKMMDFLTSREWGFILLDEVHVVPAAMFRRVVTTIKAHSKLGLTATLVREDDKIDDLNFLIGPKLYEANWMDLAANGHIANVQCAEVWCPMTPEFYREYLREKSRKRMLLYAMNPKKFQACQFLIKYHEERGDKIIVFSDNVYALEAYAKKLGKLYIHGGTPQIERMRILQNFQHNPIVNTIFLSKVGDTSIDLPEATCLIQISSHFGSRRQEAQRLGRILRAKRRNDEGFNAFFYSLVSKDTQEIYYSSKRQGFLVDQGYAFKVITSLEGLEEMPDLVYKTKSEQIELLQSVLVANESDADLGADMKDFNVNTSTGHTTKPRAAPGNSNKAVRVAGSLNALSGAQHMAYVERNKSANKQLAKEANKNRHALFKKRDANRKKR